MIYGQFLQNRKLSISQNREVWRVIAYTMVDLNTYFDILNDQNEGFLKVIWLYSANLYLSFLCNVKNFYA